MKNIRKINNDLYYIGVSEKKLSLFENVYPIPDGVSFNSYLLNDDKTILFNTVDKASGIQFFENLDAALGGKKLDYFIINHLEPDHGAMIGEVIEKYNNVEIICNIKIKQMIKQFFDFKTDIDSKIKVVGEGDTIETKNHKLTFVMAPMVHWPEVMVTFDLSDGTLYSADAFGAFGAPDGNLFDDEIDFETKIDEYRRYFTNIVGKYGPQVCALLNKAKNLDIKTICPLHGVIIKNNISKIVEKYTLWANYIPEIKSVLIPYASIYGGTKNAAEYLANKLSEFGVKNIKMFDVSRTDGSYILSDAFKYSHVVIASITYNNGIFSKMEHLISDFIKHNLQNRTYGIIQNGSWAPNIAPVIKAELEKLKGSRVLDNIITINSTLKEENLAQIETLAKEIADDILK